MSDASPRPASVGAFEERAGSLRARLDALGGSHVKILAVSKGHVADAAANAVAAGFTALGENYAQELEAKAAALHERSIDPAWHFIGRLQRNKVRRIASVVARWDSVDREALAVEIAKRAPGARVLVQVNVSDEPGKGGCEVTEVESLLAAAVDNGLRCEGLMTVGRTGTPEDARRGFRTLRSLCDRFELAECSMGMSGDLDVAVDEGSTMVRVGTALFGRRSPA